MCLRSRVQFVLIVIILFIWLFQLKVMKKPFGEENAVGTCNLTPLSKPTCSRKTILLEEHELILCFPWGTWLHFLGENSQLIVQFGPIFLVKLQQKRRNRVETNLPRRRGIGAWWLSLGTCKRAWNSLGNMIYFKQWRNMGKPCLFMTTWVHLSWETMFPQGIWASFPWATMFP